MRARGWTGSVALGMLLVAASATLVGCPGRTSSRVSGASGAAGYAEAEPDEFAPEAGAGGALGGPHATGGAAGTLAASGDAGMAGTPDELPDAAQLEKELQCLSGASFVTTPSPDGSGCGGPPRETPPFVEQIGMHFERGAAGELTLVTSTLGPWLRVERSRVARTAQGWSVASPPAAGGCFAYKFEEEVQPYWSMPSRLELGFSTAQCPPASLRASFEFPASDEHDAETLVVEALRDNVPPRLVAAEPYEYDESAHGYYPTLEESNWSWNLPRRFTFTEQLQPGWSVSIVDPRGNVWDVAQAGLDGGPHSIEVSQFFPAGSRWLVSGKDLAGNAFAPDQYYPVKDLPLNDGDFEADGNVASLCYASSLDYVQIDGAPSDASQLPALAGKKSLEVSGCAATLRVARALDATQLRFSVRLIDSGQQAFAPLHVTVGTLVAGNNATGTSTTIDNFTLDPALSNASTAVSALRDVTLALPPGAPDVMVSFRPDSGAAWIDSVRTE